MQNQFIQKVWEILSLKQLKLNKKLKVHSGEATVRTYKNSNKEMGYYGTAKESHMNLVMKAY